MPLTAGHRHPSHLPCQRSQSLLLFYAAIGFIGDDDADHYTILPPRCSLR